MRIVAIAAAALALVAVAAGSAPAATWHSFHLTALAYGTHGKCSHPATDVSGGCQGTIESGNFSGEALHGGVRWTWNHHAGTLEIFGSDFELRGTIPMHWTSFTVSSAAFAGRLFRSGTLTGAPGKAGEALHVSLVSYSTHDAKSGKKQPGYVLRLTGFLEAY